MTNPLLSLALVNQQANRASLLRREQSSRTVAKGVQAATTSTTTK